MREGAGRNLLRTDTVRRLRGQNFELIIDNHNFESHENQHLLFAGGTAGCGSFSGLRRRTPTCCGDSSERYLHLCRRSGDRGFKLLWSDEDLDSEYRSAGCAGPAIHERIRHLGDEYAVALRAADGHVSVAAAEYGHCSGQLRTDHRYGVPYAGRCAPQRGLCDGGRGEMAPGAGSGRRYGFQRRDPSGSARHRLRL